MAKRTKQLRERLVARIEWYRYTKGLCLLQSGRDMIQERIDVLERVLQDIDEICEQASRG